MIDVDETLEEGEQIVIIGDSNDGRIRYVPSDGRSDAVMMAPKNKWNEEEQRNEVVYGSLGTADGEYIESHLEQCREDDDIEIRTLPARCDACDSYRLSELEDDVVCKECGERL